MTYRSGGEGGILTLACLTSSHAFNELHNTRMDIDDFQSLNSFNFFNCFDCLGLVSGLCRHQRHQTQLRQRSHLLRRPLVSQFDDKARLPERLP